MKKFRIVYMLMNDDRTYDVIIKASDWMEAREILRQMLGLKTISELAYIYDREV